MRTAFCGILATALLVAFVIRPLHANFLAAIAKYYPISHHDKTVLLEDAAAKDPCNGEILDALGSAYVSAQNPTLAAITFGKAMECSPGNSLMRFKFGETLLMMNFAEGINNIDEAIKLERNNPVYKSESERLTEYRLR